jgi:hypothetical protein
MTTLALALLLEASLPAPRDWMAVRNGAVELALAHREADHLDGGILTIDPRSRAVLWRGIPGEMGCRIKVEVTFDDVRSVAAGEPGFALEFRKGKGSRMLLMPRPHAQWLLKERKFQADLGLVARQMPLEMPGGRGETDSLPLGGSVASAGPVLKDLDLPSAVTADTRAAVDAIRDALGRTPAPSTLIREALYGTTWETSPTEIAESPAMFEGQAVRVRGRYEAGAAGAPARLVEESGGAVFVLADTEIARLVAVEAKGWPGQTLEVTGVVRRDPSAPADAPRYAVSFWDFDAAASAAPAIAVDATTMKLPELLSNPDMVKGQLVRVVGQFRGRNLYGDLPTPNFRNRLDWVIKDDRAAVWVTGRPPRGRDFKLDPNAQDEVRSWLEVVGRPLVRDGQVVLKAEKVALVPAPSAARVKTVRIAGGSGVRPVVIFALPIEGEPVRSDTRFVLQFNKYMDEDSFRGHVVLRYADAPAEGLATVKLVYDEGKRALVVDPGVALQPGRRLECVLLPGVLDADGLPLMPRQKHDVPGVVDILTYDVER